MTTDDEALFVSEGGAWIPTDRSRGPWTRDALHGGPVAALVARAAERCEPIPGAMHVTRLSLELLRPVPVSPLEVHASVVRPGRKVQLVDVHVSSGGVDLAWGRALRIRLLEAEGTVSDRIASFTTESGAPPPGPDEGSPTEPLVEGYRAFHNSGAELRFVRGEFGRRGPATVWVRLAVPLVPGEEPSPVQRAAAAADFGNGVSSVLDYGSWIFINPDLTITLERPPVGEWICLDAATRLGAPGVGVAQSALWDGGGRFGTAIQSLLVEPR